MASTARVLRSTVQTATVDEEIGDEMADQVLNSRRPQRETYALDRIGQKVYRIAMDQVTDPQTGETRWAVAYADPAEVDVMDYATAAEAEAEYERAVRESYNPDEPFDFTDVEGVLDKEGVVREAVACYEAADSARLEAEAAADAARAARVQALAAVIEACNGNQSEAGRRIGLDQSTVNKLVRR
jgi:hypothetical protein